MLDGSRRVDMKRRVLRTWTFTWDALREAELITFLQMQNHNVRLRMQNNWDSATWYWVIISSLEYEPFLRAGPDESDVRYRVSMKVEQRTG